MLSYLGSVFEVVSGQLKPFMVKAFKITLFTFLERGWEPANDTDNPVVENSSSLQRDPAFDFGSFSVHVVVTS